MYNKLDRYGPKESKKVIPLSRIQANEMAFEFFALHTFITPYDELL